jgi:hypothetical protein
VLSIYGVNGSIAVSISEVICARVAALFTSNRYFNAMSLIACDKAERSLDGPILSSDDTTPELFAVAPTTSDPKNLGLKFTKKLTLLFLKTVFKLSNQSIE